MTVGIFVIDNIPLLPNARLRASPHQMRHPVKCHVAKIHWSCIKIIRVQIIFIRGRTLIEKY